MRETPDSIIEELVELQHQLDVIRMTAMETVASWDEYVNVMARKEKYEKLLSTLKQL